ncbi:MAG TPA: response regulator, partial [Nitrospira sp.]|nr:response regulator [Nitrospira sp.]
SVRSPGDGTPRILVADDDKEIRRQIEDRLHAKGYEVRTETDGVRVLEALRSEKFSGMILGIGIPSLDGMDVLRQIRKKDQQIPIIIVSAPGTRDSAVRAIGLGAQAYLLKPFDVEELHQVMESWFRTV